MDNTIIYNLTKEEKDIVIKLIKDDIKTAKHYCSKTINHPVHLKFDAAKTPKNIKSNIEFMLIKNSDGEIKIYKHLSIYEENNKSIHMILYEKHIENNNICNIKESDTIPYNVVFK